MTSRFELRNGLWTPLPETDGEALPPPSSESQPPKRKYVDGFTRTKAVENELFGKETERFAYCFIQWKGTDVCMDFHCLCGESYHIDGDFVYTIVCHECGRWYDVGTRVVLREMEEDERDPDGGSTANCFVWEDEKGNRREEVRHGDASTWLRVGKAGKENDA